jgi:hypothetical protein
MTRKRSSYRPRGANPTAHLMAMQGAMKLSAVDVRQRALPVLVAVDAISRGEANTENWRAVFDALNMAEQWAHMRVAQDDGAVSQMQQAIVDVLDRQRETGAKALRHDELATLRAFAVDYEALLAGVTHSEYFHAQQRVEERIRRVLAGERPPDARVIEAPLV